MEERHASGKLRNVAFVVVVAAMLFGSIGYRAYERIFGLDVVGYANLEGRYYQDFPDFSWDSILDETFQDDFEQYVSDSLPIRDQILLTHAAIQRSSIEFANLVCGYDAYPTFYGSNFVYIQSTDAVWRKLLTTEAYSEEKMSSYAEKYSRIADANPDIDWVMFLVDYSSISSQSPIYSLSANVADYEYFRETFLDELSDTWTVVDGQYETLEELMECQLLTEHHWNVNGGIRAYQRIISALGKEAIEFEEVYVAYEGPCWGYFARAGRATIGSGDVILDVEYDRSDLKLTVNGVEEDASYLDQSWAEDYEGYTSDDMFEHFYEIYYHSNQALIEIENLECDNGETLLLIDNSYGNILDRFFAENYQYVYVLNITEYDDGTLQEFIDTHDVDDAVCLVHNSDLKSIKDLL